MERYPGTEYHGTSWRYIIEIDGDRIKPGGFATSKDAWLAKEKHRENPAAAKPSSIRFGKYFNHEYVQRLERRVRNGRFSSETLKEHKSIYELHLYSLRHKKLQAINVPVVKNLMAEMDEKTYLVGDEERPYSESRKRGVFNVLSAVLSEALEDQILTYNPCKNIRDKPQCEKREVKTLTLREVEMLLEAATEYDRFYASKWKAMMALIIYTGCRRQDVVALRWVELDLKARKMTLWIKTRKKGKTDAASRTVDIPEILMPILAAWKMEAEYTLPEDYVFATDNRKAINKHCVNRMVRRAREIAVSKLEPEDESIAILEKWSPHWGRHNWASLQISSGVDPQRLADQGGWANAKVPLQIYAQEFKDARQDGSTARNIDEIYGAGVSQG